MHSTRHQSYLVIAVLNRTERTCLENHLQAVPSSRLPNLFEIREPGDKAVQLSWLYFGIGRCMGQHLVQSKVWPGRFPILSCHLAGYVIGLSLVFLFAVHGLRALLIVLSYCLLWAFSMFL